MQDATDLSLNAIDASISRNHDAECVVETGTNGSSGRDDATTLFLKASVCHPSNFQDFEHSQNRSWLLRSILLVMA